MAGGAAGGAGGRVEARGGGGHVRGGGRDDCRGEGGTEGEGSTGLYPPPPIPSRGGVRGGGCGGFPCMISNAWDKVLHS